MSFSKSTLHSSMPVIRHNEVGTTASQFSTRGFIRKCASAIALGVPSSRVENHRALFSDIPQASVSSYGSNSAPSSARSNGKPDRIPSKAARLLAIEDSTSPNLGGSKSTRRTTSSAAIAPGSKWSMDLDVALREGDDEENRHMHRTPKNIKVPAQTGSPVSTYVATRPTNQRPSPLTAMTFSLPFDRPPPKRPARPPSALSPAPTDAFREKIPRVLSEERLPEDRVGIPRRSGPRWTEARPSLRSDPLTSALSGAPEPAQKLEAVKKAVPASASNERLRPQQPFLSHVSSGNDVEADDSSQPGQIQEIDVVEDEWTLPIYDSTSLAAAGVGSHLQFPRSPSIHDSEYAFFNDVVGEYTDVGLTEPPFQAGDGSDSAVNVATPATTNTENVEAGRDLSLLFPLPPPTSRSPSLATGRSAELGGPRSAPPVTPPPPTPDVEEPKLALYLDPRLRFRGRDSNVLPSHQHSHDIPSSEQPIHHANATNAVSSFPPKLKLHIPPTPVRSTQQSISNSKSLPSIGTVKLNVTGLGQTSRSILPQTTTVNSPKLEFTSAAGAHARSRRGKASPRVLTASNSTPFVEKKIPIDKVDFIDFASSDEEEVEDYDNVDSDSEYGDDFFGQQERKATVEDSPQSERSPEKVNDIRWLELMFPSSGPSTGGSNRPPSSLYPHSPQGIAL